MKSTNIEIDSLDILQELFGINDKLIRVIENRLGVSKMCIRDSTYVRPNVCDRVAMDFEV